MNLLLTYDDPYTPHAGVTMYSFLANNPGNHTVFVISDHISEANQLLIKGVCEAFGSKVVFSFISADATKDFPVGEGTVNPTLSIATYFRLFMTELLPQEVQKILYLDCDIVVDGSLEGLWNTPFEDGKCIAALEEMPRLANDGCKRMGYPSSFSYFNAGVLLIDLGRLRMVYSVEKASAFIRKHHDVILFHDQDVLNAMFYDKKQFFNLKYNVMDTHLIHDATFPARYQSQRDAIMQPAVIHYTGFFKPWHKECMHPYTFRYEEYLRQTPWKNERRVRKLSSAKDKTVFFLKHSIKLILDALHIRKYRYIPIPKKNIQAK